MRIEVFRPTQFFVDDLRHVFEGGDDETFIQGQLLSECLHEAQRIGRVLFATVICRHQQRAIFP